MEWSNRNLSFFREEAAAEQNRSEPHSESARPIGSQEPQFHTSPINGKEGSEEAKQSAAPRVPTWAPTLLDQRQERHRKRDSEDSCPDLGVQNQHEDRERGRNNDETAVLHAFEWK